MSVINNDTICTKKTVILVWTRDCKNCIRTERDNYWGFGDLIRGAIKLFQLSKTMGFNLIVHFDLHPISLFLEKRTSEYDPIIMQNKDNIEFVFPGCVETHIQNSQDSVVYFLTNDFCDETNITDECKDFMKTILSPNAELLNLLNNYNATEYTVLHMRFGDNVIINKNAIDNALIRSVESRITHNLDVYAKNLFVCDSYFMKTELKHYLTENNIHSIDLDVGHIGYEQDREKIKNTLLEFFIIAKSNKIKTYSVYSWTSGFVVWISKIYGIPLEQIN